MSVTAKQSYHSLFSKHVSSFFKVLVKHIWISTAHLYSETSLKETKSATMNIFEKISFLFKSFVKVELS